MMNQKEKDELRRVTGLSDEIIDGAMEVMFEDELRVGTPMPNVPDLHWPKLVRMAIAGTCYQPEHGRLETAAIRYISENVEQVMGLMGWYEANFDSIHRYRHQFKGQYVRAFAELVAIYAVMAAGKPEGETKGWLEERYQRYLDRAKAHPGETVGFYQAQLESALPKV